MDSTSLVDLRLQLLDSYKEFVETSQLKVNSFLNKISWTNCISDTQKSLVSCPVNPSHKLSEKNLEKHVEKCKLQANGYSKDDKLFPEVWIPSGSKCSITLGTKNINEILNKTTGEQQEYECTPQSLERYQSTYSTAERLQIYEYVLKNTELKKFPDANLNFRLDCAPDSTTNENSAILDELALKRDLKRRRAKYRKPASRGYKQELKDTIETQMEMYTNFLQKNLVKAEPKLLAEENCYKSPNDYLACDKFEEKSESKSGYDHNSEYSEYSKNRKYYNECESSRKHNYSSVQESFSKGKTSKYYESKEPSHYNQAHRKSNEDIYYKDYKCNIPTKGMENYSCYSKHDYGSNKREHEFANEVLSRAKDFAESVYSSESDLESHSSKRKKSEISKHKKKSHKHKHKHSNSDIEQHSSKTHKKHKSHKRH